MPLSLRIPPQKEMLLRNYAQKKGKTKTAVILEALDEKLGIKKDRSKLVKDLSGWMDHDEAEKLRSSLQVFDQINEGDW